MSHTLTLIQNFLENLCPGKLEASTADPVGCQSAVADMFLPIHFPDEVAALFPSRGEALHVTVSQPICPIKLAFLPLAVLRFPAVGRF